MENFCKPPKPTKSELALRRILNKKGVPIKAGKVIWYTSCDCFTPDLLVGKNLIIEVDGKIHDRDHRRTLDRIRQRALENMGYAVHRIKNESVRDKPDKTADEIKELYYQYSEAENKNQVIITELKKPLQIIPVPRNFRLDEWAKKLSEKLDNDVENWSTDFIKEELTKLNPQLVKNQCAMEKFILSLFGYTLQKTKDGNNIDFEYSLKFFKKCLALLDDSFPENGSISSVHLKNMFNETAPGFFKNLIFKGGPNKNEGLISINNKDSLNFHIDSFTKYLSELGITVEQSDTIEECKAKLEKLNEDQKINYTWLIEWMNIK